MSDHPKHFNPRPDSESDDVENASLDSFPASDPPKWSSLRLGPPIHADPAAAVAEKKEDPSDQDSRR